VADPQYVTSREAARQIGVGVSTLQRWAARGIVTPVWRTPGGQAKWDVNDLRAQLRMPRLPLDHGDESRSEEAGADRNDAAVPTALHRRNTPGPAQAERA
jgi:hypothetical protein